MCRLIFAPSAPESCSRPAVIAAIPLVLLIAIRAVSTHYLDLFDSFEGQLVLGACTVSVVIGYQVMRWASRLPIDQRVLVQ